MISDNGQPTTDQVIDWATGLSDWAKAHMPELTRPELEAATNTARILGDINHALADLTVHAFALQGAYKARQRPHLQAVNR